MTALLLGCNACGDYTRILVPSSDCSECLGHIQVDERILWPWFNSHHMPGFWVEGVLTDRGTDRQGLTTVA